MQAKQLVKRRVEVNAQAFAELVVWQLATPLKASTHHFKYRLAYVVNGDCVLRYDNEAGKGDHKHFGSDEFPYTFSNPRQLMADFFDDIQRWNDEHTNY